MLAGGRQKAARMPPIKRPHRSALRRPPPCLAKIILANLLSTFNQELVLKAFGHGFRKNPTKKHMQYLMNANSYILYYISEFVFSQ